MSMTSVSAKYRITIPKEIRKATHIKVGDRVSFLRKGDEIAIIKVPEEPLVKMAGSLATAKDIRKELKKIKKEDNISEEERGM